MNDKKARQQASQEQTNPYTDGSYLAAVLRYASTVSPEAPSAIWVCVLPGEVQVLFLLPMPEDEKEREAVTAALLLSGVLAAFSAGNEEALSSMGGCLEVLGSAREVFAGVALLMGQVNGRDRFEAANLMGGIYLTFPPSGGIEAESTYVGRLFDPATAVLMSRFPDVQASALSTVESSMTPVPRLLSQIREEVLFTMGNNGEREPDLLRALTDADLLDACQQQWTDTPTFRQGLEQLCAEEGIPETTYPAWMVEQ